MLSSTGRSKKIFSLIILLLSISAIFVSCKNERSGWKGKVKEKNGVVIVKNPAYPLYKTSILEIEEELSLGGSSVGKEYTFERLFSLDVDDYGNIYALDNKVAQIQVFDKNGKYFRSISSFGQGPGELQSPDFIQIMNDKELWVWDLQTHRFLIFSLAGEYLREILVTHLIYPLEPIGWDSGGNLMAYLLPPPPVSGLQLVRLSNNLKTMMTIYVVPKDESYLKKKIRLLEPEPCCTLSTDDLVIWGEAKKYELQILNPEGKLIKKIIRSCKRVRLSDQDKKELEERHNRSRLGGAGYKPIFPKYFPYFRDISVDEQGRIFVFTFEGEKEKPGFYYIDIYDPEGRYIGHSLSNITASDLVWKNNKLYTIERDEEGFYVIKRYDLRWNY
jgi:hypothetical protein